MLIGPDGSGVVSDIGFTSTTALSGTVTGTIPASAQSPSGEYSVVVKRYSGPYGIVVSSPPSLFTLNVTKTPTILTSSYDYCLNDAAVSLASSISATSTLNWYSSPTGGVASSQTPTPSTSQQGPTNYFVSQTENGCESPRAVVSVQVMNCNYSQGFQVGPLSNTGSFNTFLGARTGKANTTGNNNVFVGYQAGLTNSTGQANTFLGFHAGYTITTGSNNIIIGPNSGTAITTSDENVLMGYNSQAEDDLWNATAIGANSRVAISNALILGNNANVGIGTSSPTVRLEVVSEFPDVSGLRLTNLTNQSKSNRQTDQFLTVNENGDVVKARYQLRINNASEWSDKVFLPTYQLRPLSSVATYIAQHGHLPNIPSAEVVIKEGVDLVKMNAILLEKIEELTLYIIEQQQMNQVLHTKVTELEKQQAKVVQLEEMIKELLKKK